MLSTSARLREDSGARAAHPLFPITQVSTIREAGASDGLSRLRAFETLTRVYRRPVYVYLRLKWRMDPTLSEDLTQEFFATAFANRYFDVYLPAKGRFRTFLRTCLDRLVSKHLQAQGRQKRSGDRLALALPPDEAERMLATIPVERDMEAVFDAEWIRGLMTESLQALREDAEARGKRLGLALFERIAFADGPPPTYAQLARDHGIGVTAVTNQLSRTRRRFREIVLEKLRDVTTSEEEFRSEARAVLGLELR